MVSGIIRVTIGGSVGSRVASIGVLVGSSAMAEIVARLTPAYVEVLLGSCVFVGWITITVEAHRFRRLSRFLIRIGSTIIAIIAVECTVGDPFRPPLAMYALLMAGRVGAVVGSCSNPASSPRSLIPTSDSITFRLPTASRVVDDGGGIDGQKRTHRNNGRLFGRADAVRSQWGKSG